MSPRTPVLDRAPVHTTPVVLEPSRHSRWSRYLLTPGTHIVGSAPESSLSVAVSGLAEEHAEFRIGPEGLQLRAFDPRTWVNDGPVRECRLRIGDRVTIGPCSWTVQPATTDDLLAGMPNSTASDSRAGSTLEAPAATAGPSEVVIPDRVPDAPETDAAVKDAAENVVTADATSFPQAADERDPLAHLDAAEALLSAAIELESADAPVIESPPALPVVTGPAPNDVLRLHDELQGLRRQLDSARTAWREETLRREVDLAAESTALARRGAAIERTEHELERARQDLDAQRSSVAGRESDLQCFGIELARLQEHLTAERLRLEEVAAHTRSELEQESAQQSAAWSNWEETQQRWLSRLTERDVELEARRAALQAEREELQKTRSELDLARREFLQSQQALESDRAQWTRERSDWEARCQARDAAHAESLAQVQRQQGQLTHELHERAHVHSEFLAAQQQLQHERRLFAEQQTAWLQERETLWGDLSERRRLLDRETDRLDSTRQQIEQLQVALEQELVTARRQCLAAEAVLEAAQDRAVATVEAHHAETPAVEPEALDAESAAELSESDLDAVQLALDALAARFEEFAELEQRLSNKHDELLELQQDLAVREAALNTQTDAWRQEHDVWQQAVSADEARRFAWEQQRLAAEADLRAERGRWAEHLQQLIASAAAITPVVEVPSPAPPVALPAADLREADRGPLPSSAFSPLLSFDEPASPDPPAIAEPFAHEFRERTTTDREPQAQWPRDALAEAGPRAAGLSYDPSYDSPAADVAVELDLLQRARELAYSLPEYRDEVDVPPLPDPLLQNLTPSGHSSDAEDAEPEAANDVPPSEVSLRAELARMFDLPEDFVPRDAAAARTGAGVPEAPGVLEDERLAAELPVETDAPDDDSWRSRLSALLGGSPIPVLPVSAPEPKLERLPVARIEPTPEPVAEPEEPAFPEEEDSVAAYMERLLARTRKGGTEPPPPAPLETRRESEARSSALSIESSPDPETVDEAPARRESAENRKPLDKEATRAELQSFRKVANLSARSALAKHTWGTMKTELAVQSTLAGLCTLGSAAYLSAPVWGKAIQWGPGMGCAVGATFIGFRAWLTLRKLREWSQILEPEAAQEMEASRHLATDEAAAQTESRDAAEPVLPAATPGIGDPSQPNS